MARTQRLSPHFGEISAKLAQYALLLCLFGLSVQVQGQNTYHLLDDEVRLQKAEASINAMYNWDFDEAYRLVDELEKGIEGHPVIPFSKAMILYWKIMPIDFTKPTYHEHTKLLEEASRLSDLRLEKDEDDIEGKFFKMASRSLIMKELADSGKPMKAISEARELYKLMKEGFRLKDEFVEYYFTTGVYNYYREFYPEKYPFYKPFAVFFQSGDMKKGLEQLVYATKHATFTQAEAYTYLAYIHLRYEQNHQEAIKFAKELANTYPKNLYFKVIYSETLFLSGEYTAISKHASALIRSSDPYYQAAGHLFTGIVLEQEGKHAQALYRYQKAEKLAKTMNYRFGELKAYLYFGMANCYSQQGNYELTQEYYKKAKDRDYNKYLKTVEKPQTKG